MKVLLYNSLFPPHPDAGVGGGRIAAWLVEELRRRGTDLHVLTSRLPRERTAPAWVHPFLHPAGDWEAGRRGDLLSRLRGTFHARMDHLSMRRLLRDLAPDLLVVGAFVNTHPSLLVAARNLGIPMVLWTLGLGEIRCLSETSARLLRLVFAATGGPDPRISSKSFFSAAVGSCRFILDAVRQEGLSVPIERVIYNSVPVGVFSPPTAVPQEPPFRILWISRLIPEKGFDVALAAFARIRREGVDARITFTGRTCPEYLDQFRNRVAHLGLGDRVEYLGFVDDETQRNLYRTHHLFWMTSLLPEAFSLTPLEALASGLPIVVADSGGNAEAIEDGREGYIVPPGDEAALAERTLRILRDSALRVRMGTAARSRAVERFSIKRMAEDFLDLFDRIGRR